MNASWFSVRPLRAWRALHRTALALLLVLPASCYYWQPVPLTSERRFASRAEVRVERANGSRVVFVGPRVVNDSLVGVQKALASVGRSSDTGALGAIALGDVHRAHERRFSLKRTTALVVGVAAAGFAIGMSVDPGDGQWTCPRSCSW